MNIFDIMRQSRNAAIYRMIYQQQCACAVQPQPPTIVVEDADQLNDAIENAKDGEVVKLAASIEVTASPIVIPDGKTVTVDLNGNTVSSTGISSKNTNDTIFAIRRGATLVLDDTSADKSGIVDGSKVSSIYCALKLTEKDESASGLPAKVIINGGTYIGTYYAICGNGGRQDTDVTINGGKFSGVAVDDNIAVYQPQQGNLTINGGEFEASTAIYAKCGSTVINGGTFKGVGSCIPFKHNGNGANPTGDTVLVESCDYPGGAPTIEVNGGEFISENASCIASYAQTGFEAGRPIKFVKGGTFNKAVDADLVADGYASVLVDGKYIVKKA